MNQMIATIVMDEILMLMSVSSERLGSSFERYSSQLLCSCDDVTRQESVAAVYRVKEASIFLSKLRTQCNGLNIYDKGRFIHGLLIASKTVAADASEYNALAIYLALNRFSNNEGGEYIYRAVIYDDAFSYHEVCIIGYLGFSPGEKSQFNSLSSIYTNFTSGLGISKLPWVIDATFNITARLDLYHQELYSCLMRKKMSGKVFSKISPIVFGDAIFRQYKELEIYRNKDNFSIGGEIGPVHYYNLIMNSYISICKVSKKSTESSLQHKSFL